MCKDSRGFKVHQAHTKCHMPENKMPAPPKKCFVSLNDAILSSCMTFENKIYRQTCTKNSISASNVKKPVARQKCFVKTIDILINPPSEYLNNDISQMAKIV